MALLVSAQSSLKNGLISLADKLNENNFSTWQKSVLLTIRTLKLQDHLSYDKAPPQFEEILEAKAESDTASKSDVVGVEIPKKPPAARMKVISSLILIIYKPSLIPCLMNKTDMLHPFCLALQHSPYTKLRASLLRLGIESKRKIRIWLLHIWFNPILTLLNPLDGEYKAKTTVVVEVFEAGVVALKEIDHNVNYVESWDTLYDPHYQAPPQNSSSTIPYSNTLPPPPSSSFLQPKTYFTTGSTPLEASWVADSGASHHVTQEVLLKGKTKGGCITLTTSWFPSL
ncbi:hypothetical protein PIB30_004543 [Stylosanthes scabra]|uniref:Retrotransposon Copia-like N-terminal domain-containing protein n=1 Tax=Stylosanthes scabra TaxID=79078 RepID=A0ABU6Y0C2_9FABA|nr:hypothetical protein [Stylosanthes scabra]